MTGGLALRAHFRLRSVFSQGWLKETLNGCLTEALRLACEALSLTHCRPKLGKEPGRSAQTVDSISLVLLVANESHEAFVGPECLRQCSFNMNIESL
jgi:hypothetical protein